MTPPGDLRGLDQSLDSPEWAVVREGLERAGEWLRTSAGSEAEVAQLGARLVRLARHPKWEVRRAVAQAVQHLRHETFHAVNAPLLQADNGRVREAAEQTLARRSEVTYADVLKQQQGDLLQNWLAGLEEKHGRAVREAALRVAVRFSGLMARDAYHELVKVVAPLDVSLINLRTLLSHKRLDRAALGKRLDHAQSRLEHLRAVIAANREFNLEVVPEFRDEELRSLVAEAAAMVAGQPGPSGEPMSVELIIDPALHLDAHRHRLLQAFRNLVQNALEAYDRHHARPWLRIEARLADARRLVVTFTDGGCGMSPEGLSTAFHLYSTSKAQGTGFGLPLAKKIIETEHRGSIFLASVEDEGTTVTVVLPLERDERGPEP